MKQYISEIILFITGGGLVSFFNYFREKRKDRTDEFKELLEYTKSLVTERDAKIEKMQAEYNECREMMLQLKEEINELKGKVIVLESAHFDIPFPMWLKGLDGKMISVNTEYENNFLKPNGKTAKDYINKTDEQVWGAEISKEYQLNDKLTLKSKNGYWSGKEKIIIGDTDVTDIWTIVKYVRYAGKTPIGIGGIAIPNIIH